MKIYVDTTDLTYNDKVAHRVLGTLDQSDEFSVMYGSVPQADVEYTQQMDVFATNSRSNALYLADLYPDKTVYLIENPLNKGYKSDRKNLEVVWCWDDFQFFIYFPRKV